MIPQVTAAILAVAKRYLGTSPAIALTALPLLVVIASDLQGREHWPSIQSRHEHLMNATDALGRELPKDARLATSMGFHYGMLLDRPVHSLRWAHRRAPGSAGIEQVIDRYGINTVILDPVSGIERALETSMVAEYGEGRMIGGVRVVRVRP